MTLKTLSLAAALLGASVLLAAPATAAAPDGVWATPRGKAQIRVSRCGANLCATLVGLRKPNDKKGRPKVDRHNPNPALRGRPVIGLALASGMAPDGDGWKGDVYNPDDGRTYSGRIEPAGDTLRLRGCAYKIACKTQVLTRVK